MPPLLRTPVRPSRGTVVVAVAAGVLSLGGLAALPLAERAEPGSVGELSAPGSPGWWVAVVVLAVQALALLPLPRFPLTMPVLIAATPLALVALAPGPAFSLSSVALLCAVFLTALVHPLRRLGPVLVLVFLLVTVAQGINEVRSAAPWSAAGLGAAALQGVVVVLVPVLIARMIAAQRETRAARDGELQALRREHDALIQAAISRERTAMSRELHDIAAHHMSGIALMAAAMDRQIDLDPAAAKLASRQVRAQSTAVLDDLRRIVGLLREDEEGSRSVQTLASVRELVDDRRSAGMDVELSVLEAADASELGAGVGPLAQLVVYRMVQESLSNAATHAPGARCTVSIEDRAPGQLTAVVHNDAFHAPDPGLGGGFGLLGIRERAELVQADLHYGATELGGWEVRLSVPRESAADRRPLPPATPQENT